MCFPLLYLLFILVSRTKSENEATMVQLYGKVSTEVPSTRGVQLDQTACTTKCLDDSVCVLAYMDADGNCVNYKYSEVNDTLTVNATTTTEYVVAFKVRPVKPLGSYEGMEFAYVDRRNDVNLPYRWTRTGTGWELINKYPAPWQLWKRSDTVTVFMRHFPVAGLTFAQAKDHCVSLGFKIIGVSTKAELKSLTDDTSDDQWVDGVCPTSVCTVSQYEWSDGVTTEMSDITPRIEGSNTKCLTIISEVMWSYDCTKSKPTWVACGGQVAQ